MVNTTWTVPSDPAVKFGSNAPGWWFGIQTTEGDGALIQPILAYGYQGSVYSIFNGVFDWTDASWHTSREVETVNPGDVITSSIVFEEASNAYTMRISTPATKEITTTYAIQRRQTAPETTVYFVLEHQPITCAAYPTNGQCQFSQIYIEVEGKPVSVTWEAKQEKPDCDSKVTVIDSETLLFEWSSKASSANLTAFSEQNPQKWSDRKSSNTFYRD